MFKRSSLGWLGLAGITFGFAMVVLAVYETYQTQSDRFIVLLFAGLILGCLSAPFYYYFKAKDKTRNPLSELAILAEAQLDVQKKPAKVDNLNKDKHSLQ